VGAKAINNWDVDLHKWVDEVSGINRSCIP